MTDRANSPAAQAGDAAARGTPWWCSPAGIALGFLLPMFCLVSYATRLDLAGMTARGIQFLDVPYLLLGGGLILAMALGGWLGQQITSHPRNPAITSDVDRAALAIGSVALLAYAIWFREYLTDPGLLWSILSGASMPSRGDELVSGVTSLANGGPVYFSLYAWRFVLRTDRRVPRSMHWMFAVLTLLTAFRVYAWSERLALIEALLPMALMFAVKAARSRQRWVRGLIWLGPFIALPLLMLYFGIAESVRSWSSDTYNGKIAFWDFAIGRLVTYYFTSLNNGAGFLATQSWPTFHFDYVFSMLHTAPLSVGRLFSAMVGTGPDFELFLERYGDIEFNNPSGLYMVVYDLGIPLGILYLAVAGIFAGFLYRRYSDGSLTGALFYPIFFISYLEIFRYPYLGSARAFAWGVCALLVLGMVYRGRYRHRRSFGGLPDGTPTSAAAV